MFHRKTSTEVRLLLKHRYEATLKQLMDYQLMIKIVKVFIYNRLRLASEAGFFTWNVLGDVHSDAQSSFVFLSPEDTKKGNVTLAFIFHLHLLIYIAPFGTFCSVMCP
jgi:hypothetical protein